jgi:S1-C subfamily serine protease
MRPLQKGAILGSLLAVLVSYSSAQEGVAGVVKRSSDAVVLIVISNSAGQETALGSGFLVSADGEIVTNYHVIKEAHSAIAYSGRSRSAFRGDVDHDSGLKPIRVPG